MEANPNTKITDEQFDLLKKEFSTDKDLKRKSERFWQERQAKERPGKATAEGQGPKDAAARTGEEKAVVPGDLRQRFTPLGKIDLSRPGRFEPIEAPAEETKATKAEATPQPAMTPEQPVAETTHAPEEAGKPATEPERPEKTGAAKEAAKEAETPAAEEDKTNTETETEEENIEEQSPEPMKEGEKQEEEIFQLRKPEFVSKINVIGQIDLAALNQSTRPRKKSKEEKKREREEKEKLRQDQKRQMKEAIMKEIRREDGKMKDDRDGEPNGKKKRARINKEKVDISSAADNLRKGGADHGKGGGATGQGKKNKDRFKKPALKQEVSEEDVAKQVKETLARLTA